MFSIDLQDFFDDINFMRVRGFFIKNKYFELPKNIATVLAQIVTFKNKLPQGAPTSPIISNLIGSTLDYYLASLAKMNRCHYSRYADDITFSTNMEVFPTSIAKRDVNNPNLWHPGSKLIKIIKRAGFCINRSKVSMQYARSSQRVTGLIVNKKVNIPKTYYNDTRAMVDSLTKWDKYYIDNNEFSWEKTNRLQGRLGYIYFLKKTSEIDSGRVIETDITCKNFGFVNLYKRFIFYKYFIAGKKPLVITEGKTDVLHLKEAMHKIGDRFQGFIREGKINFSFLKHDSEQFKILGLGNHKGTLGTGDIRVFLDNCLDYYRKYKKPLLNKPIIIILDNDSGLKPFKGSNGKLDILECLQKRRYLKYFRNIYLMTITDFEDFNKSSQNAVEIEDLYSPALIKKVGLSQVKGKDKFTFAKDKIQAFSSQDFIGFNPLFKKIEEVVSNYKILHKGLFLTCLIDNSDLRAQAILLENGKLRVFANSAVASIQDKGSCGMATQNQTVFIRSAYFYIPWVFYNPNLNVIECS